MFSVLLYLLYSHCFKSSFLRIWNTWLFYDFQIVSDILSYELEWQNSSIILILFQISFFRIGMTNFFIIFTVSNLFLLRIEMTDSSVIFIFHFLVIGMTGSFKICTLFQIPLFVDLNDWFACNFTIISDLMSFDLELLIAL